MKVEKNRHISFRDLDRWLIHLKINDYYRSKVASLISGSNEKSMIKKQK